MYIFDLSIHASRGDKYKKSLLLYFLCNMAFEFGLSRVMAL